MKLNACVAVCLLTTSTVISAQTSGPPDGIAKSVSWQEIETTLKAFDVDRTSGKEGERRAAEYLAAKLKEHGIRHTVHETRLFMSWPVSAAVAVEGSAPFAMKGTAPAFGASTPPGGLTADAIFLAGNEPPGSEVRGKIVVAGGGVSPDRTLAMQRAGAVGLIQVDQEDIVHEMIATTIWGSPTTDSAARLPAIPIVALGRSDGERLRRAKPASLRITTTVERGWATAPLVVAEIPGRSPDFVLVATHIDAWYRGMTDTAGTNASILEMARVLQREQAKLERGVRFAWWPGHSFGRYAGSTWYVDRFWPELDAHCVAYTNLDGAGRRGSRLDAVSAGGWPGIAEFSRDFARALTGKTPDASRPGGLFRPGRDSDSAFQGLGIPEFSIGVPGPPRGHADVEPGGRIRYWHTAEDTIDKIDPRALLLDTQYRVAQLFELATVTDLPLKIAPIAASFAGALDELAAAAGGHFDFAPARRAAARLLETAGRFDAAPLGGRDRDARNELLVRLTHRLNSRLYTKSGRFDQDPAASLPVLPLLARARELPGLTPDSDTYGFLETELLRGRNAIEATLRESANEIDRFLVARTRAPSSARRDQ